MDSQQLVEIPIEKITQTENSRADYREDALSELMTSMKQTGLLQPIGLKAVSRNQFEIVFGNRRFLAAKKLGWKTIPAIITTADTEEDFLIKNTTENVIRANVSLTEQGRIFQRLTQLGLTTSEIAARIGCSASVVNTALDMHRRIPKKYQDKIIIGARAGSAGTPKKGLIPMEAARAISTARRAFDFDKPTTDQLFDLAAQDGISVATVAAVSKLVGQGYEIKEAVKKQDSVKFIRMTIAVSKKECERIETEERVAVRQFIFDLIKNSGRIKVQGINAAGKKS